MQFTINAPVTPTHVLFPSVTVQNVPLLKLNLENKFINTHKQRVKLQLYNNPLPLTSHNITMINCREENKGSMKDLKRKNKFKTNEKEEGTEESEKKEA